MKKLLILLLLTISLTVFAQQKKVAVYVTGEQSGITKVLGDQLVIAFGKSNKFHAIERTEAFLSELSREQTYQRSGAVNDNDIARLGVQFGVNYVCVADMSDVFGEKYISARLIDVETALILNAYSIGGKMSNLDECLIMASKIANNLSIGTFEDQHEAEKIYWKIQQLEQLGYVDLGLPSGTFWKNCNEGGNSVYFTYRSAILSRFRDDLPSKKQYEELIEECEWIWIGNGYKVLGPNGNYIILPAAGESLQECGNNVIVDVGSFGYYWASSTGGSNENAWGLTFDATFVDIYYGAQCEKLSVRLVSQL